MSEDLVSVIAALSVIALAYRWFLSKRPNHNQPSSTSTPSSSTITTTATTALNPLQRRAMAIPQRQVDQMTSMFPQLTAEEVRYGLVTVKGGTEGLAQKMLTRGYLDPPPPGFFPPPPSSSTPDSHPTTTTTSSSISSKAVSNLISASAPSLISKMSLQSEKTNQDTALATGQIWVWKKSSSGAALDLKDRKEKLILEARWRLLSKERKGKAPQSRS